MSSRHVCRLLAGLAKLMTAAAAAAHGEIPCGCCDDPLRTRMIAGHAGTIEKSMRQIIERSRPTPVNYNQLVRWVNNQEAHAAEVQDIVRQCFMTQRIRPVVEKYAEKLAVLHQMLQAAMKCKQTTDLQQVDRWRSLLKRFEMLYFGHPQQ